MCCCRYGIDDFAPRRLLHNRRFDAGMVEFLECLRQLGDVAVQRNPSLKLPHRSVERLHQLESSARRLIRAFHSNRINKDKIHDVSIKYSFNSEEHWTRALKHVLYTLKLLNMTAA